MKVEHQSPGYYTYECHDPNCAYCYFMLCKQLQRKQMIEALEESMPKPVKLVKIEIKRPTKHWNEQELQLLKEMVNVPTDDLIKDKVFGERSKGSINGRKTLLRKEYNIKPLPRVYRIYHL